MKRKVIFILFFILTLFTFTACGSKEEIIDNKTTENKNDIQFTEVISTDKGIQYKLPQGYESDNIYTDNGVRVMFYAERYSDSVTRIKEYDNLAEKIEKVTINGHEYEYYKINYTVNFIIYVYRTKIDDNYFYFEFNVVGGECEDSHIAKFMETVEYLK